MAQLSTAALRSKALELSAAFAKLAEGFNGRAENATKADHLQTYVCKTATRAVTLLYDAADAGVWNEAWPWARGHKPHRYLFQHKLHDFATHLIPDAHLPTDTTGVDLLRPEEIPHQCIKPERISSVMGAVSWELGRQYPDSFRTVPSTAEVKLSDGDEGDRLEYWQQQAEVFADTCRLLSRLLRDEPAPLPAPAVVGSGMTWQEAMKEGERRCIRSPFPGVRALAELVGCAPATMVKAIEHSTKLKARQAEHKEKTKSVKTQSLNGSHARSKVKDPSELAALATDDALQRLLDEAKPKERAKIQSMTPEKQRELIDTLAHDEAADPKYRRR